VASGDESVRAFVALELDSALQSRIGELQLELEPGLAGIRFVSPAATHLTLRFLGPTTKQQVAGLEPRLQAAAAACPPLDARVRGLGTFPGHGSPGVLWLGLELPGEGDALQTACEQAARELGFEPEARPFRPHLTLGRWRERARRPTLPEVDLGATRLGWLTLFASELRQGGARHTPLVRLALGGPPT
jgi:2'-5' RNA ligase